MSEPFHIESHTPARCFELTAFRLNEVPSQHESLPIEPGAVQGMVKVAGTCISLPIAG